MKLKWLVLFLVLLNAAFFAWMQRAGGYGGESMRGHEPVHAEQIKLLSKDESLAVQAKQPVCLHWDVLAVDEMPRAQQVLQKLQLGDRATPLPAAGNEYWVYIPPLKSQKEADKKLAELKALGVTGDVVAQDDAKWRNAVSLGMFASEQAAADFLARLRGKGVKSAKTELRNSQAQPAGFMVRGVDDKLMAELVKAKLDFPKSELKAVECKESTPVNQAKG